MSKVTVDQIKYSLRYEDWSRRDALCEKIEAHGIAPPDESDLSKAVKLARGRDAPPKHKRGFA